MKASKNNRGYLCIHLKNNGNQKPFMIHRLVAKAFIPNPNNYPQVNHKNENKSHNYVKNLEWCTNKYNSNYGTRNEKLSKKCKCLETSKIYSSVRAAAKDLGCNEGSVSKACRGERNSLFGLHFIYI